MSELAQVIMDLVEGVMISYASESIGLPTADQILKRHFTFIISKSDK
ncbi:hypothetical protein [Liquorilactobacillus oeni]|nr:hypothetical protein [Liquorilactobacillus oeni]